MLTIKRIVNVRASVVLLVIILCLVSVLTAWYESRSIDEESEESAGVPRKAFDLTDPQISAMQFTRPQASVLKSAQAPTETPSGLPGLTPQDVIDNPECGMLEGIGPASKLALAVVPKPYGAQFVVLDADGAVYGGKLPFFPNHYRLGQHADGSVLAGFASLRPTTNYGLPEDSAKLARIYVDGQIIYENSKILEFDIATDGSSFFVVEALGGSSSRLVIRNLDEGTENHYFLGDDFVAASMKRPYSVHYSPDDEEVHIEHLGGNSSREMSIHDFVPAKSGGSARRIRVEEWSENDIAHIVSSRVGYFAYSVFGENKEKGYEIVKREFDWAHGKVVDVWLRQFTDSIDITDLRIIEDEALLTFKILPSNLTNSRRDGDFRTYLLDARTGKTILEIPNVERMEQFQPTGGMMAPPAAANDISSLEELTVTDGKLMLTRRILHPVASVDSSEHMHIVEVFDMSGLEAESKPDIRVPFNRGPRNQCASQGYPRTLQVTGDGRLVYTPVTSQYTSETLGAP